MVERFNIAVIPGDGIGPEVIDEAARVVKAAAPLNQATFEWHPYPWGTEYYLLNGAMAPPDFLDELTSA